MLGTAVSLATIGTVITAVITGLAAVWLFDLSTLEGLLIGSAVAATDSAAIFAVLRGSRLRKRLARTLEGESGMNDPVALLLVIGFIDWIQMPDYGIADMAGSLALKLARRARVRGRDRLRRPLVRSATSTCRAPGSTRSRRSRPRRSPTGCRSSPTAPASSRSTSPR